MNEFKGTPGPWLANPMESDSESNLIFASTLSNGTRRLVASISTGSDAPANRRLIAAAPELFQALQDIYSEVVQGALPNKDDPWWGNALAAIAKATGSQS